MGNQQSEGRIHSSSSRGIQESAHKELYVRKKVLGNRQSGDRSIAAAAGGLMGLLMRNCM